MEFLKFKQIRLRLDSHFIFSLLIATLTAFYIHISIRLLFFALILITGYVNIQKTKFKTPKLLFLFDNKFRWPYRTVIIVKYSS